MLKLLKEEFTDKGHSFKTLSYINAQIDLLEELIQQENINTLDALLRKTNFRLLKHIDKGAENIVDIYNNPDRWKLGQIEDCRNEWLNTEALIFSTERNILVFSKCIDGHRYLNNKWQ